MKSMIGSFFFLIVVAMGAVSVFRSFHTDPTKSDMAPFYIFGSIFYFSLFMSLLAFDKDAKTSGYYIVTTTVLLLTGCVATIVVVAMEGITRENGLTITVCSAIFFSLGIFIWHGVRVLLGENTLAENVERTKSSANKVEAADAQRNKDSFRNSYDPDDK